MRHAVLVTLGTDGDIYPFLHLGVELRRRGFRVTLATHEHFAEQALQADLSFLAIVSNAETQQLLGKPDFWHPLKGPLIVGRWGSSLFRKHYEVLKRIAVDKDVFMVAAPGMIAARVVQEELKTPLAGVILQPWLIPSLDAPPTMMGGLTLARWVPRPLGRLYFQLLHAIGARVVGPEVQRVRAAAGLQPIRTIFRWWFSPELVLGLFPDWFGLPQPDWPPQLRLSNFPFATAYPKTLPDNLVRFCREAQRVVAFTFGTGMMHARNLFNEAIEACRVLGVHGVFLSRFRAQLPELLPPFVHHCEFAPFRELFSQCSVVVHHGGIGTVAAALAAGTPQLIIPFAFDQMDNALRIKRLGAGDWLQQRQPRHAELARGIMPLLGTEAVAGSRKIAQRLKDRNGVQSAVDDLEAFAGRSNHARAATA